MTNNTAGKPEYGELVKAVRRNDAGAVEGLLQRGASPDEVSEGSDALSCAAALGYKEIAKLLVRKGADVNKKSISGGTPLMQAACGGDADIVAILLDHGAHINAQDEHGWTALMYTVSPEGGLEAMRLLLDRGADTGLREYLDGTVHTHVQNHFREDMRQLLNGEALLHKQHTAAGENQERLKRLSVRPVIIRGLRP